MSTITHVHNPEPHISDVNSKLNWLRAGVLGANDGIVSVAGLLAGVAATGADSQELLIAGSAAVFSGAVSMALGEYVSVSAQRDTERALVEKERWELENMPGEEHDELVGLLVNKGIERKTAEEAAHQMREHDELAAHLDLELGISAGDYTNPWVAAFASAISFLVGALLPLLVVIVSPEAWRVPAMLAAALAALSITGTISAHFSASAKSRSVMRLVIGGALAFAITYGIGAVLGVSIA